MPRVLFSGQIEDSLLKNQILWIRFTSFRDRSKLKKGHFESKQKEENNEFQHNGINKIPTGDLPFKVLFSGQIGGFSLEQPNFMDSFFF